MYSILAYITHLILLNDISIIYIYYIVMVCLIKFEK